MSSRLARLVLIAITGGIGIVAPSTSMAHPSVAATSIAYLEFAVTDSAEWFVLQCTVEWPAGTHFRDQFYGWIATDEDGETVDGRSGTEGPNGSGTFVSVTSGEDTHAHFLDDDKSESDYWTVGWSFFEADEYRGTYWRVAQAAWEGSSSCFVRFDDGSVLNSTPGDPDNARAVRAADFRPTAGFETGLASAFVTGEYRFTSKGFMLNALRLNGPARCIDPTGHVYNNGTMDQCTVQKASIGEWIFQVDAGLRSGGPVLYAITIPE